MIGRVLAAAYVLSVAPLATVGFATGSPAPILVAALLCLPTSVPAGIGFYVVVGLLGQLPGANPDSSSGSTACSPDGICTSTSTGDAATWFLVSSDVLGVTALVAAAVLNLLLVRAAASRRARTRSAA